MSSPLADLRRWFRDLPPPPTPVDWAWAESELGFALPSDYKEFCDLFGGCRINYLFVHAPLAQRTLSDGIELVRGYFGLSLYEYREAPGWPDYQRLLLWGEIDSEKLLCWDRNSSSDPDEWRTVVFNRGGRLVWLDGNMTTCIRDFIAGRQRPAIFGGEFDDPDLVVSIRGQEYPIRNQD